MSTTGITAYYRATLTTNVAVKRKTSARPGIADSLYRRRECSLCRVCAIISCVKKRDGERPPAGNMSLVRGDVYLACVYMNVCVKSVCGKGQHFLKSPSSEEHVLASVTDLSPATH